eukprot:scaffold104131_cov17-Tisochrysis_lutea.AAC.1
MSDARYALVRLTELEVLLGVTSNFRAGCHKGTQFGQGRGHSHVQQIWMLETIRLLGEKVDRKIK